MTEKYDIVVTKQYYIKVIAENMDLHWATIFLETYIRKSFLEEGYTVGLMVHKEENDEIHQK